MPRQANDRYDIPVSGSHVLRVRYLATTGAWHDLTTTRRMRFEDVVEDPLGMWSLSSYEATIKGNGFFRILVVARHTGGSHDVAITIHRDRGGSVTELSGRTNRADAVGGTGGNLCSQRAIAIDELEVGDKIYANFYNGKATGSLDLGGGASGMVIFPL